MDDRKRQINEAEQRKKEQTALLDALLAHIGEAIFERTSDSCQGNDSAFGELATYRRLQNDIASSQDSIQAAEEQIRRFKELEEGIDAKEREETLCAKDLGGVYGRLGKLLLEESAKYDDSSKAYDDFCAPYQSQADELLAKVQSLEERLSGLEQKEKGNVFSWIGKSAQSLVLRSFLGKAQENLEQVRRTVGERFSRRGSGSLLPDNGALDMLCNEIEQKRLEIQDITHDLASLKDEKRKISDSFSSEGGPIRYIQTLKNQISQVQNDLKVLYRRIGAEASLAESSAADTTTERRELIQSFIKLEDRENLDSAMRMGQTIRDCDEVIEKLKASLAIDDEKAKIEKYRRMIHEKRDKIAQAERNILEFEEAIGASEANIEKLRHLM
ncbi:MAG: hypothetical protein FWB78_09600 [Treponema sp.]|nr:hypothetical protein [Treponema sp.]